VFDVCDNTLPQSVKQVISLAYDFVGIIFLVIIVIPVVAAVILPFSVIFFLVQKVYVATSRQLKRLESNSRSPIYSHFGETLAGSSTIRAFNMEQTFITETENKIDLNQICYYPSIMANRWQQIVNDIIGNVIIFSVAVFAMTSDSVGSGEAGLIITYALQMTAILNYLVRFSSEVQTNIVAVERIKEYSDLPQEASWKSNDGEKPSNDWPQSGAVNFNQYAMRYRDGLDLVIKGISCDISGGEKVGIVGRTGAGKSSLTMAMFRLCEPAEGGMVIDNKDTCKLGLHDLRPKITIIPQDPVLFSGSLRMNLDPFNIYNDEKIWSALKLSHLFEFVSSLDDGIMHEISEGGDNLSVGQRQLVCLARALLKKTRILVLDEATAAVDLETDDLIQGTIRKEFKESTVLTIAHRLNTIMDYDRIMVLDKGKIAEFDTVKELLKMKDGIFHSMVKDAGLLTTIHEDGEEEENKQN
jgi:ATP-binding cassette subfamily C (CFTR/MRP) protein 1